MKRTLDFFKTVVLMEKKQNFLQFLDDLGLDSTFIIDNGSRGNYQLYQINLSELDDMDYSKVRARLTDTQISFL